MLHAGAPVGVGMDHVPVVSVVVLVMLYVVCQNIIVGYCRGAVYQVGAGAVYGYGVK